MATNSSSSSAGTQTAISASAFLTLAPATAHSCTPAELRRLVLDYLSSCCYADSAKAFAREVDAMASDAGRNGQLVVATPDPSRRLATNGAKAPPAHPKPLQVVLNGEATSRNGARPMDDVEATPPPEGFDAPVFDPDGDAAMDDDGDEDDGDEEDDNDGDSDELEELEVESALRASNGTNGKAVAFHGEEEDNEDPDPDEGWPMLSLAELKAIRLRRDIRNHILQGRVQSALDLLNEHYPAVITTPPRPSSSSPIKPLPTSANSRDSCRPTNFFVPTTSSATTASFPGPKPSVPVLGSTFKPAALSLKPEVIALNLQLQSFVEHIRSANVASSPSTPTGDSPSDGGMSGSTSSLASSRTSSMTKAIKQSQALLTKVGTMTPGKERDEWEQECVDVSGLMAYTDLAICPVRGYLSQSRREILAELVNAAVLQHTKQTPMPIVSLAARQATAIWSALAELKTPFPPPPPGANPKERTRTKTYPKFDLRTFLNERELDQVSVASGDPR